MSKRMEVATFGRAITIPGVVVSKTALVFERVDAPTLEAVGAFMEAVDGSAAWWWGDLLVARCGYDLREAEKELGYALDEVSREEKQKQYTSQYAAIAGKEAGTLWHYRGVAKFYDSCSRLQELSWAHHFEAKVGSGGDLAVAQEWLERARAKSWTKGQLRAAIKASKRAAQEPDEPMPQMVLPMEVVECRRYATATLPRVTTMEEKEARMLLAELAPVLALAQALAARVQGNIFDRGSSPKASA
ncbi:MAG TPA: hypothetical protein VGE76_12085 [Opitutaceae bacterium]